MNADRVYDVSYNICPMNNALLFVVNTTMHRPALFHLSLLGGFGAPLICKVLKGTGYLSGCGGNAYRRLLETGLMVIECMGEDSLVPHTGKGWHSVLAVRLLHSMVRTRILSKSSWNIEEDGIPISQEDLRATQYAFSTMVCTFFFLKSKMKCSFQF